jgi:shikimate kinase
VTTPATLAIIGMPGTGKTTLANAIGDVLRLDVFHTDDFKDLPWSQQADHAMATIPNFAKAGAFIIEGITVARLFRRGFLPDCVIYFAGGGAIASPSLQSLLVRGLLDYDKALVRGHVGRVLHVPEHADSETVLWLMGTLGPE